jgi:hypothetical protein
MASMLADPHTPQALVLMVTREKPVGTRAGSRRSTSRDVVSVLFDALRPRGDRPGAVARAPHLIGGVDDALGEEVAVDEVEVGARGTHGHGDHLTGGPDLQGLLDREHVGPARAGDGVAGGMKALHRYANGHPTHGVTRARRDPSGTTARDFVEGGADVGQVDGRRDDGDQAEQRERREEHDEADRGGGREHQRPELLGPLAGRRERVGAATQRVDQGKHFKPERADAEDERDALLDGGEHVHTIRVGAWGAGCRSANVC